MSFDVIHILLLDGKVLCVQLKNMKSELLFKHLFFSLNIKSYDTLGLTYTDSRGLDQWLDESKLISDHDIVPCEKILKLIVKIRYIPHHVCQEETNIHHLMLVAIRLLRQNWFLLQPEIHSQLVALFLLSKFGANISDSDIHSTLIRCKMSMVDPVTKNNYFDSILDAYRIYSDQMETAAEFSLKFLQLMMRFPIFNSKLFVIANAKGDKFMLGINSVRMTILYLNNYHEPMKKIDFKYVDNVMHRDLKIVISLGDRVKNQRNVLDNETVIYFALSTHQSDCIYAEIMDCWEKYKISAPLFTINQLQKDEIFKKRLNDWLSTGGDISQTYSDYHGNSVDIHMISIGEKNPINVEKDFGEMNMYKSDIYNKLSLSTNNDTTTICKPMPDFVQLSTEEDQLKNILYEKMNELCQNFCSEKELTGVMPPEYLSFFPTGNTRFTRNSNQTTISRQIHKGCAAEVKNKLLNGNMGTKSRAISRDNLNYHSSSNIKGSMSPSITANRMTASHSVSDLRLTNSSIRSSEKNYKYPMKNFERLRMSAAPSPYQNATNARPSCRQSPLMSQGHRRNTDNECGPFFKKQSNKEY